MDSHLRGNPFGSKMSAVDSPLHENDRLASVRIMNLQTHDVLVRFFDQIGSELRTLGIYSEVIVINLIKGNQSIMPLLYNFDFIVDDHKLKQGNQIVLHKLS